MISYIFFDQPAADSVPRIQGKEGGPFFCAGGESHGAAGLEETARGKADEVGNQAGDFLEALFPLLEFPPNRGMEVMSPRV